MYVKKFRGATASEALAAARRELGEETLLLGIRRARAGGAPLTEVTVALERSDASRARPQVPPAARPSDAAARPAAPPTAVRESRNGDSTEREPRRYYDLEARFDLLSRRARELGGPLAPATPAGFEPDAALPEPERIAAALERGGLDGRCCAYAVRAAFAELPTAEPVSEAEMLERVASALAALLPRPRAMGEGRPRVEAFVGPTGTGKTTTLAKIATIARLAERRSVAIVTADPYRVGAVEQIREYASVIDVPWESARDADSLSAAVARQRDVDLLLVDTEGVPATDSTRMWELGKLLRAVPGAVLRLVLSATTRRRDLATTIARYRALGPLSLVFTKLDETDAYGELLAEAIGSACPVAWLGLGPAIPDDLDSNGAERLSRLVASSAWPGSEGRR